MEPSETENVIYLKSEYRNTEQRSDDMTTELSHKVGLVLHVDDTLGESRRSDIEEAIEDTQGVTSAHFTDRRPHLMVVEYDPELTSSASILDRINHQSVHAELIGPI